MNTFKKQCVELRKKDFTLLEIMKITGRSKTSVYFHIKDIPLSDSKRKQIADNSRLLALRVADSRRGIALRPFKPFDEWTPEMVLLTAHLIFDGRLAKACEYNNRSTALINRVRRLMKEVYDFPPKQYPNFVTGVMRISYANVVMANFFKDKSKELLYKVTDLPSDCQREFLRAFLMMRAVWIIGCLEINV